MELFRALLAQGIESVQGSYFNAQSLSSLSLSLVSPLSIDFLQFEFVPANGSVGGSALLWKDTMGVRILVATPNLINALFFFDPVDTPWQLTGVYGPQFQPCKIF